MPHIRTRLMSLMLALVLGQSVSVLAQEARHAGESGGEVQQSPVVIDGETLFSVRGVTAYPAGRRAREVAGRIRAVAANRSIGAGSLTLEEHPTMTAIVAAGQRIVAVLDEDAALEGIAREHLAEVYRRRISEAIEAYRRDRRFDVLGGHIAYALGATVLLLLGAYGGRRIVAFMRSGLERRYQARVQRLEGKSLNIVKVEQIWRVLEGLLNVAWGLALIVVIYGYLNYVLALFPWTRSLARSLFSIAIDPLRTMGSGLLGIIPNLAFLAILVGVTRYALKIIRILFDGLGSGTVRLNAFDPEWAAPTYRLVRLLAIACALVVAYPYIPGSESNAFKGVSLFIGIIFSLGSSSLMGNFIAGYSMTYRRAFKVGDRVKIGQHIGDVEQMGLMVTHLCTPKNEVVVVPNSMILANEVINYSSLARESGLILYTTVGIGYETPWRQVEAMLLEAAARTPGLVPQPAPFVLQTGLGDFCVTYEINVYCDTPKAMAALYTELRRNILDVFNEYAVQIMTPAYEGDPEQAKIVPREQWYAAPARPPDSRQPAFGAGSSG